MPFAKWLLLGVYYYASYPYRAWANRRRAAAGSAPVIVLFYHRIADDRANPWTMSTKTFIQQMEWLGRNFEFVSLDEAQRRIASSSNHRPAVHVTFDDGYAENCEVALPYLIQHRIPCTYFVASHHVITGEPFAHDLAHGQSFPPNTIEQIREIAAAGIQIGSHTRTHADLGRIADPARLRNELVTSRRELERVVGKPVDILSFPFGLYDNLTPAAFRAARDAGYRAVLSAYGGFNFPGDDSFHLQRIHADVEHLRLKNWATVDPRKLNTKRFDTTTFNPATDDALTADGNAEENTAELLRS